MVHRNDIRKVFISFSCAIPFHSTFDIECLHLRFSYCRILCASYCYKVIFLCVILYDLMLKNVFFVCVFFCCFLFAIKCTYYFHSFDFYFSQFHENCLKCVHTILVSSFKVILNSKNWESSTTTQLLLLSELNELFAATANIVALIIGLLNRILKW